MDPFFELGANSAERASDSASTARAAATAGGVLPSDEGEDGVFRSVYGTEKMDTGIEESFRERTETGRSTNVPFNGFSNTSLYLLTSLLSLLNSPISVVVTLCTRYMTTMFFQGARRTGKGVRVVFLFRLVKVGKIREKGTIEGFAFGGEMLRTTQAKAQQRSVPSSKGPVKRAPSSNAEILSMFVDEPADPGCVEVEHARVKDEGCFDFKVGTDEGDEV
ncbi:hypothetical protein GYMLUDRAFT_252906 [Collybiopsis luxurians FD-317 M1]|uniref:Uncharacterized protein n=1 Tax=Collybiopsis luxurians FD-317 M1 TaxID=944289 RepID=A0A0D0B8R6_9AGAR|nr:hypothetical protein GYMLUDRAFT_252906 [Collybiopsis luxurians FD-317 M1]